MTSTRSWYAILSSAICASWISNGSLIFLDHLISWMSELGKSLSDQKITWDSMIPLSVSLLHHLPAMIREISSNPWRDPPLSSLNTTNWGIGISDASNLSLAWAFHSFHKMKLVIQYSPAPSNLVIFERELEAMIEGQLDLMEGAPPMSSITWIADNAGAIFVSRREMSSLRKVNPWLTRIHDKKTKSRIFATFEYIESK